ncbi:MAG: hypothetical protein GYA86_00245 [Firmicutes bacterium]|jgi:hypothetical protein|nr:hypothetical protein [Bacillota bacterium]
MIDPVSVLDHHERHRAERIASCLPPADLDADHHRPVVDHAIEVFTQVGLEFGGGNCSGAVIHFARPFRTIIPVCVR